MNCYVGLPVFIISNNNQASNRLPPFQKTKAIVWLKNQHSVCHGVSKLKDILRQREFDIFASKALALRKLSVIQ